MTTTLSARIETIDALTPDICQGMFAIYSHYYAATSFNLFLGDLENKTHVLLLFDQHETVRGFTTLARYFWPKNETHEPVGDTTQQVQIVFSGDTIIEHDYWGQQVLPMAWIEQTGRFKAEYPELPLYWFLIVKGYRTYRYLSVFSKTYHPCVGVKPTAQLQELLHSLATDRFGQSYQLDTGCIVFSESRGHLSGDWADIPERVRARADVAFFLAKNPGFMNGDELACITELSVDNLTRRARVAFERGLRR